MDVLLSPLGLLGLAALAVVAVVVVRYRAQKKVNDARLARRVAEVVAEAEATPPKKKVSRGS